MKMTLLASGTIARAVTSRHVTVMVTAKVGIPNFVSGPGEYIMEGEYVILKITGLLYLY